MKLIFPQDYTRKPHPFNKKGVQFRPILKTPFFISIVGGAVGLYGDGIKTFELMIGDRVHGYLSIEEINEKVNQALELLTQTA